jgi:TetR/AcrR family transcriptional repressor of mexCD-oprJ operon
MSNTTHEEQLLRKLTAALSANPRGTTGALAEAAGISRATFNRFCGSRENLMEMIKEQAEKTVQNIIAIAQQSVTDYTHALTDLISAHFENREYLIFACGAQDSLSNAYWNEYLNTLDEFFLNGQKSGVFRIDFSKQMLTELFVSMICAMIDAENRGRVSNAEINSNMTSFFLNGVGGK